MKTWVLCWFDAVPLLVGFWWCLLATRGKLQINFSNIVALEKQATFDEQISEIAKNGLKSNLTPSCLAVQELRTRCKCTGWSCSWARRTACSPRRWWRPRLARWSRCSWSRSSRTWSLIRWVHRSCQEQTRKWRGQRRRLAPGTRQLGKNKRQLNSRFRLVFTAPPCFQGTQLQLLLSEQNRN